MSDEKDQAKCQNSHSVLILATKNCCAQFRKQNNHSIGIIGFFFGKENCGIFLVTFCHLQSPAIGWLSQSTLAGDWFLCRWWATSLRPTHHYQWSSRSYFWFLGKKKERLKKIRARPTSLGQYGSIRNDKVQRLCFKKKVILLIYVQYSESGLNGDNNMNQAQEGPHFSESSELLF